MEWPDHGEIGPAKAVVAVNYRRPNEVQGRSTRARAKHYRGPEIEMFIIFANYELMLRMGKDRKEINVPNSPYFGIRPNLARRFNAKTGHRCVPHTHEGAEPRCWLAKHSISEHAYVMDGIRRERYRICVEQVCSCEQVGDKAVYWRRHAPKIHRPQLATVRPHDRVANAR